MRGLQQDLERRRIVWIDDFVSQQLCSDICAELEFAYWRPSAVIARTRSGGVIVRESACRVSETAMDCWFSDELTAVMATISRQIAQKLHVSKSRYEPWQALRYRRGGRFDYHHDGGYWREDVAAEREITLLLYLSTPLGGGSTHFRELGLDVQARAGRLVIWKNLLGDGSCDPRMVHCSVPLRRGRKVALVTWIRQRPMKTN